ncbi:MAG TPA: hypothetical protein VEI47_09850 [Gemmatimonadales bacterium]|jgi:hypothetical protein|nr:hypothetical protein [Gemmatimonadales bacterium]
MLDKRLARIKPEFAAAPDYRNVEVGKWYVVTLRQGQVEEMTFTDESGHSVVAQKRHFEVR